MLNISIPADRPSATVGQLLVRCLRDDASSTARVVLYGELDMATATQLDIALRRAQAGADLVVLDLRTLEFMDCAGLHTILAAHRRMRLTEGRLVVVRGPVAVERLFSLLGISHLLELVDRPPDQRGSSRAVRGRAELRLQPAVPMPSPQ